MHMLQALIHLKAEQARLKPRIVQAVPRDSSKASRALQSDYGCTGFHCIVFVTKKQRLPSKTLQVLVIYKSVVELNRIFYVQYYVKGSLALIGYLKKVMVTTETI